jgi:hypothetical protein
MYPHERSLVKRKEGKPFALVGVNSDVSDAQVRKAMAENGITWRSFIDGGLEGPIDTQWGIRSWPSIFVIDGKGVIRFKDVRGKELDKAVDQLLKEMGAG